MKKKRYFVCAPTQDGSDLDAAGHCRHVLERGISWHDKEGRHCTFAPGIYIVLLLQEDHAVVDTEERMIDKG